MVPPGPSGTELEPEKVLEEGKVGTRGTLEHFKGVEANALS